MEKISATEAAELLQSTDAETVVLLDVREDVELSIAAIDGALHIPMGQIPKRINELNPDHTTIVMCHTGGRSAQVATFLRQRGFSTVLNLDGGIKAWTRSVDPNIAEY